MKRCSECDFTFEDHQQVCDFDGTELTIIPESVPKAVRTSPFRRLARSRVALAALVLAGLISSALLIGYYDSASQSSAEIASNSESRNETANPGPQGFVSDFGSSKARSSGAAQNDLHPAADQRCHKVVCNNFSNAQVDVTKLPLAIVPVTTWSIARKTGGDLNFRN